MGIFDQIKSAFGGKAEFVEAASETYTVQSGDTLWRISEEVYGDGSHYMKIFEANTGIMESPEHTLPGQELKIPR